MKGPEGTSYAVGLTGAYEPIDDLAIVVTYFNPLGYRSRARNYEVFRDSVLRCGLHLLTIECAFGDAAFTLRASPRVLQVRSRHVMWQKERLLNIAIRKLPRRYTKVAWVDGDVLFENRYWARETSRLLERHPIVQPFETAARLPPASREPQANGTELRGFAAAYAANPESLRSGAFHLHGETGLAWAARRSVLERGGLYDACIVGGGDHVMAHAMCGDWSSPCIDVLVGLHTPQVRHLRHWGEKFYRQVRANMAYVSGAALHLWHGAHEDRQYVSRHQQLIAFGFDPEADLQRGTGGCYEWASDKPEMHRWAAAYFATRREDAEAPPAPDNCPAVRSDDPPKDPALDEPLPAGARVVQPPSSA